MKRVLFVICILFTATTFSQKTQQPKVDYMPFRVFADSIKSDTICIDGRIEDYKFIKISGKVYALELSLDLGFYEAAPIIYGKIERLNKIEYYTHDPIISMGYNENTCEYIQNPHPGIDGLDQKMNHYKRTIFFYKNGHIERFVVP